MNSQGSDAVWASATEAVISEAATAAMKGFTFDLDRRILLVAQTCRISKVLV